MENNHSKGHAFRLDFKCTNNMAKYEMLLSHSWGENLHEFIQLDMSYATISVFG